MAPHRLQRVRRARGRVPARRRRPGRDGELVEADQSADEPSEHSSPARSAISARSSRNSAPYAARLALSNTSVEPPAARSRGSSSRRAASRSLRRRRFRSTTLRPYRGTTSPTLGCAAGEARRKTSRCGVSLRFPRLSSSRISFARRIRADRGRRRRPGAPACGRAVSTAATSSRSVPRDGGGPCGAAAPEPCARPSSPCGHGTRACSAVCGCAGDTLASWLNQRLVSATLRPRRNRDDKRNHLPGPSLLSYPTAASIVNPGNRARDRAQPQRSAATPAVPTAPATPMHIQARRGGLVSASPSLRLLFAL